MDGWKSIMNPGVWRLLPRHALLVVPVLIALIIGAGIDWLLRPASTVMVGDNGAVLLGHFFLSIIVVVLPDLIWSAALVFTAVLAAKVLNNDEVEPSPGRLAIFARDTFINSWPFIGALTVIQVVLTILLPIAGFFAFLLAAVIIFACAFALPAYVISGVPTFEAFRASAAFAQQRPLKVMLSLIMPLTVLFSVCFVNILLEFMSLNTFIQFVIIDVLMSVAITYSILQIKAIYHRSSYEFHVTQEQTLLTRALYSAPPPPKND
jgi:hypothetical protein